MKAYVTLLACGLCSALPIEQRRNAVKASSGRIWPNAVIPYHISSAYPTVVQNIIRDALKQTEDSTKVHGRTCVHFQPRDGESHYMYFYKGTGCHTPVGMNTGGKTTVTIGSGCERKGTVMHEVMHGLGFFHEHSRPDRDNYVTVHNDNIQPDHAKNFDIVPSKYIDEQGQHYDYGSIMHANKYEFAIDRSKPTIEPKHKGVTIGQRYHLSPIDIKEVQLLYGCT